MEDLIRKLLDPNQAVFTRMIAFQHMINLFPDDVPKFLLLLLFRKNEDKTITLKATQYLTQIIDKYPSYIRGMLEEMLFEEELECNPKRAIAASILGKIHAQETLPELRSVAQDKNENKFIRISSIESIGAMGKIQDIELLIHFAKDDMEEIRIRVAAIIGLGWMNQPQTVPTILEMMEHENREIWLAALDSIEHYDSNFVNRYLLNIYSILESSSQQSPFIAEILKNRNMIALCESIETEHYHAIRKVILDQGIQNLSQIELLRERSQNIQLRQVLDEIVEKLEPNLSNSYGMNILL